MRAGAASAFFVSVFLFVSATAFAVGPYHLTDLGMLPNGYMNTTPSAINSSGEVVGYCRNAFGNNVAFRWTSTDGIQSLGIPAGAVETMANGLNDNGQIVGTIIG